MNNPEWNPEQRKGNTTTNRERGRAYLEYLRLEEAGEHLPPFEDWLKKNSNRDGRALLLTPANEIHSTRPMWLWDARIPLGTSTVCAGKGGEGKSSFALYLAARINAGSLEGDLAGQPASVLIVSHEDDWGTVMVPRLKAAGAHLERVYRLSIETTVDDFTMETVPALPLDLERIKSAVQETGAKLLIVDPITSTIGGDLHKVTDVRKALDPLTNLAQELQIAVIAIMHFNKGTGNASEKLSGSHAFRDAVRSVLLFATDEETGQRVVTIDKSNYSKSQGESFAFNLVSQTVETSDGEQTEVGRVEYLGATELTVSEIINRQPGGDDDSAERTAMEDHIYEYLFDCGGSAEAKDVIRAGQAQGFREADLKKARFRMKDPKIVSKRLGFGKGAKYIWAMDSPMDSMDSKNSNPGTHGTHVESMQDQVAPITPIGGTT